MLTITIEQFCCFLELGKEVFILKQLGSLGDNHWLISYYFRLINNTFDPQATRWKGGRKSIKDFSSCSKSLKRCSEGISSVLNIPVRSAEPQIRTWGLTRARMLVTESAEDNW